MIKVKEQNIIYEDKEVFEKIKERIKTQSVWDINISAFAEKSMHKMLKYYLEPDEIFHEKKVCGHIADIYKNNMITEIQSINFSAVKEKIKHYLEYKENKITFVYPVAAVRNMCWVDKKTGETSKITKSLKFIDIYKFYEEIYHIKDFMGEENFNLKILLLEVLEYKFLDGWGKFRKNNATKIDKVPVSKVGEENFNGKNDYLKLIPSKLREEGMFTVFDLKKETGMGEKAIRSFIYVMKNAGLITENGRKNRYICYKISQNDLK